MKSLVTRALAVTASFALMSALSELILDFVFRIAGKPAVFTSFYSLLVFSAIVGFIPSWPSPSRLSELPIGWGGRCFLVIETAVAVALAATGASRFLVYARLSVPVEISAAIYIYGFVLVIFIAVNFSRMRSEAASYGRRKL